MKIDKEALAALMALPDRELWQRVREIAGSHGFNLPEATPSKSEMDKMREAVSGCNSFNLATAMRLLNEYKRGKK